MMVDERRWSGHFQELVLFSLLRSLGLGFAIFFVPQAPRRLTSTDFAFAEPLGFEGLLKLELLKREFLKLGNDCESLLIDVHVKF